MRKTTYLGFTEETEGSGWRAEFRWTVFNSQFHRKSEVDHFEVDKRSSARRLQPSCALASELQTGMLQSNRSSATLRAAFALSLSLFFFPF